MDFSATLAPYAWLWWTVAFLYNPAVIAVQQLAPRLVPLHTPIRNAWGVWNAGFAGVSLLGFMATQKVYGAMIGNFASLCSADSPAAAAFWDEHYSGPVQGWVLLFIVSKLFELGDTLFLAALGKPIIFLYWYHHLTILVYMYVAGLNWHPYMISGVVWKYGVHAVMYAYYASSCFGLRWPKFLARNITTLQLAQMFANLALLVATFCCCGLNYHMSMWPTTAMYAVYACLFMDLYRERYSKQKDRRACDRTSIKTHQDAAKAWQSYVTIDGYEYDITDFARKRPGGSVIKHYAGLDATAAFKEFHSNSKRASTVLRSLPKRAVAGDLQVPKAEDNAGRRERPTDAAENAPGGFDSTESITPSSINLPSADPLLPATATVPPHNSLGQDATGQSAPDDAAIMADFAAWRASLVARGLFRPRPVWQLVWFLLEPLAITACGCWLMKATGSVLPGVILLALANVRCGWIQHEGGHSSLTTHPKMDKLIQSVAIGLGLSSSGWVWNNMHNKHHATPNKINHDMDLNTLPLVAFYKGCLEKDSRAHGIDKSLLSRWLKFQAYTFLPVTTMAVSIFWFYFLHPIKAWKTDKLGLLLMLASHVVKPALFVVFGGTTFMRGYLLMTAAYWMTSAYLFGHFSLSPKLSHTFMPVVEETDQPTWVRFALEHSVDISPGNWLVDWIMGYLNYQVIHHLFPTMPQCYGPVVSQELRTKAEEWGIAYTTVSYFAAWKAMLTNLDVVGRHYSSTDTAATLKKAA